MAALCSGSYVAYRVGDIIYVQATVVHSSPFDVWFEDAIPQDCPPVLILWHESVGPSDLHTVSGTFTTEFTFSKTCTPPRPGEEVLIYDADHQQQALPVPIDGAAPAMARRLEIKGKPVKIAHCKRPSNEIVRPTRP